MNTEDYLKHKELESENERLKEENRRLLSGWNRAMGYKPIPGEPEPETRPLVTVSALGELVAGWKRKYESAEAQRVKAVVALDSQAEEIARLRDQVRALKAENRRLLDGWNNTLQEHAVNEESRKARYRFLKFGNAADLPPE